MVNRLAESQSLYLRKHADNPIDWWPWCDEALAKAKQEDKPIFLSIGYSSCHWCTVMEGEAFSDTTIADYMNTYFLPIKVDREERPDLDSIYMQTLQMIAGQGGWPLNVFLAPDDLVPFYGGTYFPLEPKYGRPSFLQVLQALRGFYDADKTKLDSVKSEILENLQQAALLPTTDRLGQDLLLQGLTTSARILVPVGTGTSFPMMPYAEAALRGVRFEADEKAPASPQLDSQQVCTRRGLDLALGGIYDHVGGGFHRYTVDPTWTVPHFEKMLYDNGQIVEYLAGLWTSGVKAAALRRAVEGTVCWLLREMTAPQGYFYAAQDADSFIQPTDLEPEEGAFYVWRYNEMQNLLSQPQLLALQAQFTVTEAGNFEGQTVLQQQSEELDETVIAALAQLFKERYGTAAHELSTFPPARNNQEAKTQTWPGRIPPVTDTKMIVAWNALMISGLAKAAIAFRQPDFLHIGLRAARFILEHQWSDNRLQRLNYEGTPAVLAQSEDYAFLIKALLDLQQAKLAFPDLPDAIDWLQAARDVQAEFDEWLWSPEGGYYNAPSDTRERLLVRERSFQDSATPSANGIAIASLVRLSLLTEDLTYLDRAEQALKAFGTVMEKFPRACPSLFVALDWFRHSTLIRTTPERIPDLAQTYLPTAVFAAKPDDLPESAIALVCQGLSCLEPALSQEQLLLQIGDSLVRQ
ncbi:thioredoxin domain-containing protein [Pseudanabaena sp. FACHB-2040]|uniref:thioredoxin domain-containing protein n=1 Tax=Pseudanabaena sp. FACHB-2040 TaxID=2692859 RepID=UPI00168793B1|nr:thioredoxin domain-containing protein [Pseudanabaena sp. FACHB-2040]MBD2260622.1 thioredoxin domain-containing protein [Pseudanabaena sp. FACHB-2040]